MHVATLPCFKTEHSPFCSSTLYHPYLNPRLSEQHSAPTIAGVTPTPVGGQFFSLRHPLCTPLSLSHTQSPVRISHSHYTPLRSSHTGLVIHRRCRTPHLGSHLRSHLGFFQVGSHLGSLVHLVSLRFSKCTLGVCQIV